MKNPAIAATLPWPFSLSNMGMLQRTRAYDMVMRLPFLGYAVFFTTLKMAALAGYAQKTDAAASFAAHAIGIAMRLSTIVFLLVMAAAVILRTRPREKASGVEPRVSALIGTFLIYAIALFPRRDLSVPAEIAAAVLTLVGTVAAIVALLRLGYSFSLMAEARRLVVSGPYRFVRHPLYLAEELAAVGVVMQFLSIPTTLIFVVQIAFQLRRMHNEEAVLTATFPEYAQYRARTARLIPGIY